MTDLQIKFSLSLKDYDIEFDYSEGSLLFHRWLPNGEENAINIETRYPKSKLKIWFERYGYVKNNEVIFDLKKQEVDPEIMDLNGILHSGPLHGLLILQDISTDEEEILRKNLPNDPEYIKLAKKIIRIIDDPLFELINLLRTKYGQHWIYKFSKWNSQTTSAGNYLNRFQIKFKLDGETNWQKFHPQDISVVSVSIMGGDYREYFTKKDWEQLSEDLKNSEKFSLAILILMEAQKHFDQENIKLAFIDGVAALDLAISEFFSKKYSTLPETEKNVNKFLDLPLPIRIISTFSLEKKISENQIQDTLKAVEIRNSVAHKGHEPTKEEAKVLSTLFIVISVLLPGLKPRLLTSNTGNAIMSKDSWEKDYQKF